MATDYDARARTARAETRHRIAEALDVATQDFNLSADSAVVRIPTATLLRALAGRRDAQGRG